MDNASFDRIARLLGGATTRRAGLGAAFGGLLGLGALQAAEARRAARDKDRESARGKPDKEGPCGDGSRKDNICTKDKQCCTGYCQKNLKNKDGKGRCRCIPGGKPCKPSQTCCRGTCVDGRCRKPKPGGIPTGQACIAASDTCQDSAASCIPYYQGDPAGTYCLLRGGDACSAATDCGSKNCASGVCVDEACTVCPSGCPYVTIQAAVIGESDGSTILIAGATYSETVEVPARNLTLTNCNGGEVIVKNVADNTRTFILGTSSDTAPHPTVIIRNLTIAGKGTPVAGDATPVTPTVSDGGIEAYTNLILEGTTKVTGCNWLEKGGGISMKPQNEALILTLRGQAEVSDNFATSYGGGIFVDLYDGSKLVLEDDAKVTRNYSTGDGGGISLEYRVSMEMSGNAEVSYNRSVSAGGGGNFYCGGALCLKMTGSSRWIFNAGFSENSYGGAIYFYDRASSYPNTLEMYDDTLIADNQNLGTNQPGAGIYGEENGTLVVMQGNARITRNTLVNPGNLTDGAGVYNVDLDIRDNAAIIDNTPGDCRDVAYEPGSKQCGVA